ncbi:peptidyl-dipeptidase [Nitritalea halalkaliphila LW7]|uniref:Peptidyl-dipeptidase n=1 Tax=Nitritalea halalkaliphila LW7 TaxID=1189621 RepID=I5C1M2_9BACT|nr:M3 family metallopeptidase [Nitritalea halalkaliphila]EIM75724.1 peptidyl-dipeptidase [Nitritalea halalkaliphila LW7]
MSRLRTLTTLLTAAALWSCSGDGTNTTRMNPFFEPYATPFEVPPFDSIEIEHFKPAMEAGIKEQQAEIDAIVEQTEAPTFENTIEALENSGALLSRVQTVFGNLNSAHTNAELQAIAKEMSPALSAHGDNIRLNEKLFARIRAVYEQRESLNLNEEQRMLLEKTYKSFVRSGANLQEAEKEKLREINSKLALLSLEFGQNLLAETNDFQLWITDEADLAGLPSSLRASAKADAEAAGEPEKWLFTLQNPSVMPFLQYAENRALREKIWDAYQTRSSRGNDKDNTQALIDIANLRLERAQLLGYETHAAFSLEETMAKNAGNVYTLLNQLWTPALAKAKAERDEMQALHAELGEEGPLQHGTGDSMKKNSVRRNLT